MPSSLRSLTVTLSGLLLAGAALAGPVAHEASGPPVVDAATTEPAGFAASCIGYCKHPTNAAKVFRWGVEDWRQEFERGRLRDKHWRSSHPRLVGQRYGMITLRAKPHTGRVTATARTQSAKYGRWEARIRAVELTRGAHHYRFWWELVPSGGNHCRKGVVLASYKPGAHRAKGEVRTAGRQFTFSRKRDLRSRAWHTYAVEVTRNHVSWFVDTRVVRTERRDRALTGVELRPRLRIEAEAGGRMNDSRLQADWVRYYTLKRPNAKSIKAPQMDRKRYRQGC